MFQFTDSHGTPVTTPDASDVDVALGSDIAFLPVLLAAAREADEQGYCAVYDQIAEAIGGPTRHDLRDAGLLTRKFTVTGTRRMRVYFDVDVPFEVEGVEAVRSADIRDGSVSIADFLDSTEDVSGYTVRDAISVYESYTAEDEDGEYEIDHVSAE